MIAKVYLPTLNDYFQLNGVSLLLKTMHEFFPKTSLEVVAAIASTVERWYLFFQTWW